MSESISEAPEKSILPSINPNISTKEHGLPVNNERGTYVDGQSFAAQADGKISSNIENGSTVVPVSTSGTNVSSDNVQSQKGVVASKSVAHPVPEPTSTRIMHNFTFIYRMYVLPPPYLPPRSC